MKSCVLKIFENLLCALFLHDVSDHDTPQLPVAVNIIFYCPILSFDLLFIQANWLSRLPRFCLFLLPSLSCEYFKYSHPSFYMMYSRNFSCHFLIGSISFFPFFLTFSHCSRIKSMVFFTYFCRTTSYTLRHCFCVRKLSSIDCSLE